MNQQPASHYDALSRAFHWVTAISVMIAFILGPGGFGRLMHNGLDPASRLDIVWHESLGILVFVLTLLRLVWLGLRPAAPQFVSFAIAELAISGIWSTRTPPKRVSG